MMSKTFDTNDSSASTERAAGQRDRYAHGSEIGEAVVASGTQKDAETFFDVVMKDFTPPDEWTWEMRRTSTSFVFSVQWNEATKADAATLTHEPGRRSS